MTKQKSTKRALLMSALSLLVCVSMLIGSTFAWFTDSVTSAGNIIKSGTLDVTMEWADGTKEVPADESTDWKNAAEGAIFESKLWEPGYTEVRHIKIANEGTLALKYQLNILANGEVSELADVIDVYYLDPAAPVAERTALTADKKIGTLTEVLANSSTTASGELKATEKHTVTLALKMQETAGNEYQDLAIGSDFSIQLLATQLASESDSFGNDYDTNATYLNQDADGNWLINNVDELVYFAYDVNSGNDYEGESVKLTADINLGGREWNPIGYTLNIPFRGIFDGDGHTISNFTVDRKSGSALFGFVRNQGNVALKNLTVKDVVATGGDYVAGVVGQLYAQIENCHAINVTVTATPFLLADGVTYDGGAKAGGVIGWMESGTPYTAKGCTATNVTVQAYRDLGGVIGMAHNNNTVTGCKTDGARLGYIYLMTGAVYSGNSVNGNMGEVIGRRGTNVIESNNTSVNVVMSGANVYTAPTATELQNAVKNATDGSAVYITNASYDKDLTLTINAKDVSLVAQNVNVTGNLTINSKYTGDIGTVKISGFNVTGALNTTVRGDKVVVENNNVGSVSFNQYATTTNIVVRNNVIDGKSCGKGNDRYGLYLVAPNIAEDTPYDITITGNVFRNTNSYAIALQGNGASSVQWHTVGKIDVSGNTFESWAVHPDYTGIKYSAFKIWNDKNLAPTQNSVVTPGDGTNTTDMARALKDSIIANNTFGAAMEGKAKVNFYDFYFM